MAWSLLWLDCDHHMTRVEIAFEANQTLARFYAGLDAFDTDAVVGCFHPDAVWLRHGTELRGHDDIRRALLARISTRRFIHVMSNVLMHFPSDAETLVRYCVTLYAHDVGQSSDAPAPTTTPKQVGTAQACLAPTKGVWLLRHMQLKAPAFQAVT